jgi:anti-sigma B factor antagonist
MKNPEQKVYSTRYKDYIFVHFENFVQLDLYNTMDLVTMFQEGNEKGQVKWALDMTPIQYIDSSGLGVLSRQGRFLREKSSRLVLVNLQSSVQHLLTACGLNWLFDIQESEKNLQ